MNMDQFEFQCAGTGGICNKKKKNYYLSWLKFISAITYLIELKCPLTIQLSMEWIKQSVDKKNYV